jgi:hypothetical protein
MMKLCLPHPKELGQAGGGSELRDHARVYHGHHGKPYRPGVEVNDTTVCDLGKLFLQKCKRPVAMELRYASVTTPH